MPQVYNRHHTNVPRDAVYIGRGSRWGNPYSHQDVDGTIPVNTRDDAVNEYELYLSQNPDIVQRAKDELKGKNLVCYCAPARCHGDLLLSVANA